MSQLSVHDVAAYILEKFKGQMTTWKLQKLVYYSQAWSLVWDERPLFSARIEAWANGPVVPELYKAHQGQFRVEIWKRGSFRRLDKEQSETVDSILKYYGRRTGQQLSDLTHREKPWREARRGLGPDERGNTVISLKSMSDYYSSLPT